MAEFGVALGQMSPGQEKLSDGAQSGVLGRIDKRLASERRVAALKMRDAGKQRLPIGAQLIRLRLPKHFEGLGRPLTPEQGNGQRLVRLVLGGVFRRTRLKFRQRFFVFDRLGQSQASADHPAFLG